MKIAFVSQPLDKVLPPKQNSVGIWTAEVARLLAQSNQVIVYINGDQRGGPPIVSEGVEYRKLRTLPHSKIHRMSRFLHRFYSLQKPFFASTFFFGEYALQAAISLKRENCDVIHIQNFSQFVPIIRAYNPHAKIVLHMHCEWLNQLDEKMIESRLRQVDLVIGCSEYIAQKVRDRFPHMAEKCKAAYNGVDTDVFFSKSTASSAPESANSEFQVEEGARKPPRLLFLGRISPEKGVHVLIDALPIIAKQYPDVQLTLIGSCRSLPLEFLINLSDDEPVMQLDRFYQDEYIDSLKNRLQPDLREQVSFLGNASHDEIPDYIRNADVLVNPSLSEAFGMSLIEAMACQKPVVASRVGGMVEVIENGKNGLLVEPDSPQSLAEGILRLLADPQLCIRLGQNGRERVLDRYSWEPITNQLNDLYRFQIPKRNPIKEAHQHIPLVK